MSFIFSRAVKSCKMKTKTKTKYTLLFRCFTSETCKIGRAMLSAFFFFANTRTHISLSLSFRPHRLSKFLAHTAFISIYHCLDFYSHESARIRMLRFYFYQQFTFPKFHIFLWICFVLGTNREIVSTKLCV